MVPLSTVVPAEFSFLIRLESSQIVIFDVRSFLSAPKYLKRKPTLFLPVPFAILSKYMSYTRPEVHRKLEFQILLIGGRPAAR